MATQLHVDVFVDPKNRWAALAQSTLTILSSVLGLALSFLIPKLPIAVRADLVLAISVLVLWRTVRVWWPVVRIGERGRWKRLERSFWLLIVPVAAYLYLLIGAIQLMRGDQTDGLITVAGAFLTMFGIALRNSWRLVVSPAGDSGRSGPADATSAGLPAQQRSSRPAKG